MAVSALGYSVTAENKGGYPNGYMLIANQLGILDNINVLLGSFNSRCCIGNPFLSYLWLLKRTWLRKSSLAPKEKATGGRLTSGAWGVLS